MKKKQKVDINSMKLYPKFNKEAVKNKKLIGDERKKLEDEKKKQEELINLGVYYQE